MRGYAVLLLTILLLGVITADAFAGSINQEPLKSDLNFGTMTRKRESLVKVNIDGREVIIINSLPVVINESGYYVLNISANISETAIRIESNNVVLNGGGNTLKGTNSYGVPGIDLEGINNITIKNLWIRNFDEGILVKNSSTITLDNISFYFVPRGGIYVESSYNISITHNYMRYGNVVLKYSNGIFVSDSIMEGSPAIGSEYSNVTVYNSILRGNVGIRSHYSHVNVRYSTINATYDGVALYDSTAEIIGNSFWGSGINLGNSFFGNVIVNNSINGKNLVYLESEHNKNITTPDYAGQIILVNCSNITISNQTIYGNGYIYGTVAVYLSEDIKIFNNTLGRGWRGIYFESSENIMVFNNNITENRGYGIELYRSRSAVIQGNTLNNNQLGVSLDSSSAVITGNIFIKNEVGIELYYSPDNIITNNTFTGGGFRVWRSFNNIVANNTINGKALVYLEGVDGYLIQTLNSVGQVIIQNSENITILNQNLSDTNVGLYTYNASNVIIKHVSVTNNSEHGAIRVFYSQDIFIENAEIKSNEEIGIYIYSSKNIRIKDSNITDNWRGIELSWDYDSPQRDANAIIDGNYIGRNSVGIYTWYTDNITIHDNMVYRNADDIELDYSKYINIYLNSFIGTIRNELTCRSSSNVTLYSTFNLSYKFNNSIFNGPLGNYWGKYAGEDGDGDGIGDVPYHISDQCEDQYPLVYPTYNYTIFHRKRGDIDGDKQITAIDALLYLRYIVRLDLSPFKLDPLYDDLTGDNRITIEDALKALRIAAGLETLGQDNT